MESALSCNKKCLEILVGKGASVNEISKAFKFAAANQRLDNAEYLLDAGIDMNYNGIVRGIDTLLESTFKGERLRLFEKLIAAGTNVKTLEALGLPILRKSKEKECTDFLISEGADVNFKDRNGCTPLHLMALHGNVDCSVSLISAGADVNKKNKEGETPLMKAAHCDKVQFAELLLQNGADINAYNSRGRYAIFNAAWAGSAEILQLLLKAGDNVNKTHSMMKQYISLVTAVSRGHEECVRILLQEGADVNISDDESHTALMCAAHNGQNKCVRLLLAAGADVNFTSHYGTALSMMAMEKNILKGSKWSHKRDRLPSTAAACVDQLIQAGADVNVVNSDNQTALMLAAFSNYLDCVKSLLKAGAKVGIVMKGFSTLPLYVVGYCLRDRSKIDSRIISLLHAAGETKEGVSEVLVDVLRDLHRNLHLERSIDLDRDLDRDFHHCRRHKNTNKDCMTLAVQYLSDDDPSLCLKHICRQTIREHLLQMSRIYLFVRVPHLGLPPSLARYLLNDLSVD